MSTKKDLGLHQLNAAQHAGSSAPHTYADSNFPRQTGMLTSRSDKACAAFSVDLPNPRAQTVRAPLLAVQQPSPCDCETSLTHPLQGGLQAGSHAARSLEAPSRAACWVSFEPVATGLGSCSPPNFPTRCRSHT